MTDVAMTAAPDRLLRWPLAAVSLAILGVTIAADQGALALSFPPVVSWMLVMTAVAFAICSAGAGAAWRRAALIAAVLWLGVSAQLALTEPNWFQFVHLRPTSPYEAALWGAVALQGLVAAALLLVSVRRRSPAPLLRALGPMRLALVILLLFLLCTGAGRLVANHAYGTLAKQIVAGGFLLAVNLASLVALATSLPAAPLGRLADRIGGAISLPGQPEAVRPLDRWLPWAASAFALATSVALARLAFGGAPHLPDEIAYLFQARYMAEGAITVPAPPQAVRDALAYDFLMVHDGRWFAITPPGWPAVLALGVRLGAPWLVNPLLGAFAVLMAHQAVSRLASRGMANVVAVLIAASPWFLATSASMMTHALTLALMLAAVRLLADAREGRVWAAFVAGAAMGLVFLARPVDGLIAGVLGGLWTLTFLRRPAGWAVVAAYGLGCLALGGLVFPYNAAVIGDPLLPPLQAYQDALWGPGSNRMGFGPDIGPPNLWHGVDLYRGHSPFEAVLLTQLSGYSANFELFGWPGFSLALVFAWLVWGRRRGFELALACAVAVIIAGFALYWYADTFYIGPRYWALMIPALVILSAAGAQSLAGRLSAAGVSLAGARIGLIMAGFCLFAVAAFFPWRAVTRYHDHRGFHDQYQAAARDLRGGLVFVDTPSEDDLASALALNSPFLRPDRPIFLRDLGPAARAAAAAAFPGRPLYFTKGRGEGGTPPRLVSRF